MNQKNQPTPQENLPAAISAQADPNKSIDSVRADLEKNRQENQALYTIVETWILGEGSKGENKINFDLWSNTASAEKDLSIIFRQFPEFKQLHDSITGESPEKKESFIRLFREKLNKKVTIRADKKRELALLGKEKGSENIGDYLNNGWNNVKKWAERGQPEDYVKIGGVILGSFMVYKIFKFVWNTTVDQIDENPSLIVKGLVAAGLGTGLFFGMKEAFQPKSAYASDGAKKPKEESESISVPANIAAQQKSIEEAIETQDGARALLGLTHAPLEEVLDNYRKSEDFQMNPNFLANYTDKLEGWDKKWVKKMIKKISPKDLHKATTNTFKAVENSYGYQQALLKDKKLTILDYVQREYVDRAKAKNTTITFSEFAENALMPHQG